MIQSNDSPAMAETELPSTVNEQVLPQFYIHLIYHFQAKSSSRPTSSGLPEFLYSIRLISANRHHS